MKIDGKEVTNSTIFILPMFGLPLDTYKKAGFVNAFIKDTQKVFDKPVALLVFYCKERYVQDQDDIITMMDSLVIDIYGYNEKLLVVAVAIPEKFIWDYQKITFGQYSALSDEYQEMVSDKVGDNPMYRQHDGRRLQLLIIQKDDMIKQFLQKEYDIEIDNKTEVWHKFDIAEETITPQLVNKIIYTPFRPKIKINRKGSGESL